MTTRADLVDAREAIVTAVALGAVIPASSGTVAYLALHAESPGLIDLSLEPLGVFSTLDKAITALASRIRAVWAFDNSHYLRRTAPWVTEKLYDEATTWRSPREDITEEQYALMLTVATAALAQLRTLQSEWFASHSDIETVLAYRAEHLNDPIDAGRDDLTDPMTWHPYIQVVQIDTEIERPFSPTDPGR